MQTEHDTSEHQGELLMDARRPEERSRPSAQRCVGTAGLVRAIHAAKLLLIAAIGTGCAASNYNFDAHSTVDGHVRVARLTDDLALEREGGRHQELYDMGMIPLARTHLNVFSEEDDEGYPGGFVEADIDAYLPLFGFVDATVSRYDNDRNRYERHDYNSYLWGLFQTHRERVDTKVGLREKRMRRFLWIFGWESSPKYVDSDREIASQ